MHNMFDMSYLKQMNLTERRLIGYVYQEPGIRRSELTEKMAISRQALSLIFKKFRETDIFRFKDRENFKKENYGSGIFLKDDLFYMGTVVLNFREIGFRLQNAQNKTIIESKWPNNFQTWSEHLPQELWHTIDKILKKHNIPPASLLKIQVLISGRYSDISGELFERSPSFYRGKNRMNLPNFFQDKPVQIKNAFVRNFPVPVSIEKHTFVTGEYLYTQKYVKNMESLLAIWYGFGSTYVYQGKAVRGHMNSSSDLGNYINQEKYGKGLRYYFSFWSIFSRNKKHILQKVADWNKTDIARRNKIISDLYEEGDMAIVGDVEKCIDYFGESLYPLLMFLKPSLLIFDSAWKFSQNYLLYVLNKKNQEIKYSLEAMPQVLFMNLDIDIEMTAGLHNLHKIFF